MPNVQHPLHIDSSYRNLAEYPVPTEFSVPVNSISSNNPNDTRNIFFLKNNIFHRFVWIGNTRFHPLEGLDNDTLQIQMEVLSSVSFRILDIPSQPETYYLGCMLYDSTKTRCSLIISYSSLNNVMTISSPCGIPIQRSTRGFILNGSFRYGNNLTAFYTKSVFQMNLSTITRSLSTSMFVINQSQNWNLPIQDLVGSSQEIVFPQKMPSYDSHDIFVIQNSNANSFQYRIQSTYPEAIRDFQWISIGTGYQVSQVVTVTPHNPQGKPAEFIVLKIDCAGGIVEWECQSPGSRFQVQETCLVSTTSPVQQPAQIQILRVTNLFTVIGDVTNLRVLLSQRRCVGLFVTKHLSNTCSCIQDFCLDCIWEYNNTPLIYFLLYPYRIPPFI